MTDNQLAPRQKSYPGWNLAANVLMATALEGTGAFAGVTYLDHAAATLYSEQHLSRTMKDLSETVYGNPHSRSECSQRTAELVELVRSR